MLGDKGGVIRCFTTASFSFEQDFYGAFKACLNRSRRAGRYQTVFRLLNPGAARADCAVLVMGARPRSVRTRIAHAACPQDPEVVIAHNLLVIVRLLFCLLPLLRILEPTLRQRACLPQRKVLV